MAVSDNDSESIQQLIRAVRVRVPVDAAELLALEPIENIEAVLRKLPQETSRRILAELPEALRPDITFTEFADPPVPGQVSELMEPARGVMQTGATVQDAIEYLRGAESVTDITYLNIVDAEGRLLGLVVIRDLILAQLAQPLDEIMISRPFSLRPDQAIADAIKAALRRHYPVYPVTDADGKLLGIVRGWRLAERQAIEISAQSGQMVGVDKAERVNTPMWDSFRKRHPWLQLNLLTAFAAAIVVGSFSDTIEQIVVLAAFLPVLAGQSGNTGLQALTITLRSMILGDIDSIPRRKLLIKEISLAILNGALTGVVAGVAMYFTAVGDSGTDQALLLALVILLAMTGACLLSGISGVLIPLGLKRLGADPATASSIFLTTITDVAGMGLMLFLATVLIL